MHLDAFASKQAGWREQRCAHAAGAVVGDEVMRMHGRCAAQSKRSVGGHTALDQRLGRRHVVRGQQHRRPDFQIAARLGGGRIEVARKPRRRTRVRAQRGIEAQRQRAGDRVAIDRIRHRPGQREGLRALAEVRVDLGDQRSELFRRQHGLHRQLDAQHLGCRQLARSRIELTDFNRIRVGSVDHQAQLGRRQSARCSGRVHPGSGRQIARGGCCERDGCARRNFGGCCGRHHTGCTSDWENEAACQPAQRANTLPECKDNFRHTKFS